ncbi:MAG: glycosyltransferase [Pseudomonadota bacterium]
MGPVQETAIVVPCYNEAGRFAPERFVDYCRQQPNVSFVFVDDGSADETFEVLSRTAAHAPDQMRVVRLDANSGKAEAVRRGVIDAFRTSAELIGFWDADLATPLNSIQEFAKILERPTLQMAIGSRVRLLGRNIERDGLRHYLGRGFATVAAFALRLPIYDTQCGAKIFRSNAIFKEIFSEPFELGWTFDVEMLARLARIAKRENLRLEELVAEVPLQEWIDTPGSKLRVGHVPRIAWEVVKLFAITRRH